MNGEWGYDEHPLGLRVWEYTRPTRPNTSSLWWDQAPPQTSQFLLHQPLVLPLDPGNWKALLIIPLADWGHFHWKHHQDPSPVALPPSSVWHGFPLWSTHTVCTSSPSPEFLGPFSPWHCSSNTSDASVIEQSRRCSSGPQRTDFSLKHVEDSCQSLLS